MLGRDNESEASLRKVPDGVKLGNLKELKLKELLKELFRMTPDLLERKVTVLNKSVGKRLKTGKLGEKVAVLTVTEDILRVEVSRVEDENALLVSVTLLNLEV